MPERNADWRTVLREVVDERRRELGSHPELDELVAYRAGELPAESARRLEGHLVLCPECARLLLELETFAADAARPPGEPRAEVVPIETFRARRWSRWIAAAATAAAAVAFFLFWPRGDPLPGYAAPELRGALRVTRSAESPPRRAEVPAFAAGGRLDLKLRPETAVEGPIRARAYLHHAGELRALSATTLEVSADGVVSLEGEVGSELLLPGGESELIVVVARPGALPSRRGLLETLADAGRSRERRWAAFARRIEVLELSGAPRPSAPAPEAPDLRVEYAGCRSVVAGPRCLLPGDRRLTLWVKHHRGEELRIEAGGRGGRPPATEVQDGYRYRVEVSRGARELVVELEREEEQVVWALELHDAPEPPWLKEARALYEAGDWDAARRLLEPLLSGVQGADAGPALSLLARIERRSGRAELGEKLYRRALAAHRGAGRLSEQVRDGAGLAFHLIEERRFPEARELLGSLPVEATGGSAEARAAVAYARGLLAEETGDLRAASAWMVRSAREAERAGLSRRQLFAEDLLARQLSAVGLLDAAAELRARMQPRIAELCGEGGGTAALDACACARLEVNRAWAGLLAFEAGRPGPGGGRQDPLELSERMAEAERAFLAEAAREASCLLPEDLPNLRLNRALVALHAGNAAAARYHLAEAAVDPVTFPRLALWQLDVEARIALAEERPEAALERYDELARRAELAASPEAAWRAAFGRATALAALERPGEAIEACARAEGLLDRESLLVPMQAGRASFLAQRERAAGFCLDLLLDAGREAAALALVRRSAARALRSLQVGARVAGLGEPERRLWERAAAAYRRAADEVEGRASEVWRGLPRDREARLERELEGERRRLRGQLDRRLALLGGSAALVPAEAPPPAAGELVLAYHPLPEGWAAIAADEEGTAARRLEPGGGPLEARSEAELASWLLEPFAARIARASEVQVVAYGPLRGVGFHALPFAAGLLLDRASVVYRLDLPAPVAAGSAGTPPARSRALVVAGPGLLEAPAEAREVESALTSWPGAWQVDLLEGEAASRGEVLRRLADAALFHYAGHADYDEASRGWDSHLALSDGGRLTVDDVLASPRVPRWVVLSGCETGRDARAVPLANVGLAQAFLVAGSEAVVAATGEVSDAAAASLMAALYRHWEPSTSLAAALRAAQLERRGTASGADWRELRVLVR